MTLAFRHMRLLFDKKQPYKSVVNVRFRVSAIRRVNPKSRREPRHSEKLQVTTTN